MRKFLATIAFTLTGLTFNAQAADSKILGRWISVSPYFEMGEITVKLAFDFQDSTTSISTVCSYPGRDLEAIVNVPTITEGGKITVLEAGEAKIVEGGMECNNIVDTGVTDYKIENETLVVTANGVSMAFIRR